MKIQPQNFDVQGKALGMPYDFRMPTVKKFKERMWNKNGPMLTPKAWGWGWDLNFAHRGTQVLLVVVAIATTVLAIASWSR